MSYEGLDTPSVTTDLDNEYEILGELGRGGMAIVYLARDRQLGREVAIKVIRAQFIEEEEAMTRFAREARTVAQLHHPNIVTVHAVKRLSDGSLAIVMHHVPGCTLKQLIRQEGPLSIERAEQVLADIADALGFAHEHGIIHRDVKPENILIDESNGRALLFDFGIARTLDSHSSLTMTGIALGTPAYMSPEQIDGAQVDGRSDLYSLGLVGWEMLTGKRPWEGEGLYSVIFKQKNEHLTPIQDLRPEAPSSLRIAIEGALQKDPKLRWSTADDFLAELTQGTRGSHRSRWRSSERDRQRVIAAIVATREQRASEATPTAETIRFRREEESEEPVPPLDASPMRLRRERRARRNRRLALAAAFLLFAIGGAAAVVLSGNAAMVLAPFRMNAEPEVEDPPSVLASDAIERESPPALETLNESARALEQRSGINSVDPEPADSLLDTERELALATGDSAPPADPPPAESREAESEESDVPASSGTTPVRTPSTAPEETTSSTSERGTSREESTVPQAEADASIGGLVDVAVGGMHTCALGSTGVALCWGSNDQGQLGNGSTLRRSEPTRIGADLRFRSLAAGMTHTCAIARDGQAYCWGDNDQGQLGSGDTSERSSPAPVEGSYSFTRLWLGLSHSCGVTSGGESLCWGGNDHGQIGDGTRTDRTSPVRLETDTRLERFALGWQHTCALSRDGYAICWGENGSGQLGDGTATDHNAPMPVAGSFQFRQLTAGSAHSCGVLVNGQALCWGRNTSGQLGNGTMNTQTRPVSVQGGGDYVQITAGSTHTCALNAQGHAFCWGGNSYGQLGDGTTTDRTVPVRVGGGHIFATIAANGAHTCGITEDGERLCWGYNLEGQLGNGTRTHQSLPVSAEM